MPRTNTSRRKIMDTAASVFAENGFWTSSMDDVATAAGVAKGTLYYNFPTKTDLFVSVIEDGVREMRDTWEAGITAASSEHDLSLLLIKLHVDMFMDYGEIAGIFFEGSFRGLDRSVLQRIHEIREEYVSHLAATLSDGINGGSIRAVDTQITAYVLLSSIYAACRRFRETGDSRGREFLYGYMQSLIIDGIGSGGLS